MLNPQLNANGELAHLLSIDGLPRDVLVQILDTASSFLEVSDRSVKKSAIAARQECFQPVFRKLDENTYHL